MAQQVEHVLGKDEVAGSNPANSSKNRGKQKCLPLFFGKSIVNYRDLRAEARAGASGLRENTAVSDAFYAN